MDPPDRPSGYRARRDGDDQDENEEEEPQVLDGGLGGVVFVRSRCASDRILAPLTLMLKVALKTTAVRILVLILVASLGLVPVWEP